jgi:hypothetical protein
MSSVVPGMKNDAPKDVELRQQKPSSSPTSTLACVEGGGHFLVSHSEHFICVRTGTTIPVIVFLNAGSGGGMVSG